MKRVTWLLGITLVAVLVAGAGYLGARSTVEGETLHLGSELESLMRAIGLRGRQAQADAAPAAHPTVPVSRGDVQQTVIAPGQLVGTQESVLGIDVAGRLAEINVRPGDVVHTGEVLARLDPAPLQAALEEAQLRLAAAESEQRRRLADAELALRAARLRLEQAQTEHPRQLAEAELALQAAVSGLEQAQLQYPSLTAAEIRLQNAIAAERTAEAEYHEALERQQANWEPAEVAEGYLRALESARDARAIAAAEYSAAQGRQAASGKALQDREAEIEHARIALQRLQDGVDPLLALELEKAHKALANLTETGVDPLLELAVRKAQADLEAATLIAPFDSAVLNVRARPGETLSRGAELITLADPTAVEAQVTVIEEDLPLVQVGQPAEIFFDARPEVTVQGQVARIVPQRIAGEARPLYQVYLALEALPEGLLSGMTVDASIIIDQRTDVLRLPRALVRAGSGATARVEVWADGRAQERPVQVGLRGDAYIEILGGLSEGERVVGQ
jgi:multidrug efflux pump subunit AcrA (membrane-fusion protein)